MTRSQGRPEAELEVELLDEFGQWPELAIYKNEVGKGFYGRILPQLEALCERGPQALYAGWRGVLHRNWVTWGLGDGSPDWVGHLGSQVLYVELKAPGGRLRAAQRRWHGAAAKKGATVHVVRNVQQMRQILEGNERCR